MNDRPLDAIQNPMVCFERIAKDRLALLCQFSQMELSIALQFFGCYLKSAISLKLNPP